MKQAESDDQGKSRIHELQDKILAVCIRCPHGRWMWGSFECKGGNCHSQPVRKWLDEIERRGWSPRRDLKMPLGNLQMEKYLRPTPFIDCDSASIQEKTRDLTQGQEDVIEKAKNLFYFVRDEIKYDIYIPKHLPEYFQASNVLSRGTGYCVHKAVLLAALARAEGIPARLRFARIRNNLLPEKTLNWLGTNILPFHGYAELHLDGKWVKATPALDLKMCSKNKIIPVEFDGRNDAMFHRYNQEGKLHIEYLVDLGQYDDLPLGRLREEITKYIGSWFLEPRTIA